MFELFNPKIKSVQGNMPQRGHHYGMHSRSLNAQNFRQYISQRTKDVCVGCYFGKECAIKDYASFSLNKIYKKEVIFSSSSALTKVQQP